MKISVVGKGDVDLSQKDYKTQGGEGKIYVRNNTVYKIYEDPSKMISVAKIKELSVLNRPNIIKPEDVLLKNNKPIGHTMKYVPDAYALCQLFTKAFKQRTNLDNKTVIELVKKMQETISFIHSNNILIVDLNEMNFLVDNKFNDMYFIDVNSYQTPSFPATAIMDSIRDRHCHNKFSPVTDWFSFGIVSFQMFIGIHPYKGKHPKLSSLDERMKNNISVFNKDVSTPAVCYPLDVIPDNLRDWYKTIFEKGERLAPPMDFATVVKAFKPIKKHVHGKLLEILKLKTYDGNVIDYISRFGQDLVLTDKNLLYTNNSFYKLPDGINNICLGFTPKINTPVVVYLEGNSVKILDVTRQESLYYVANASNIMSYEGTIYYHNNDQIIEIQFMEVKDKIFAAPKVVGQVMEKNTQMFDGLVVQSMLSEHDTQTYLFSVFPSIGQCYQFFVPELSEYRIINAKFLRGILVVIGVNNKTGKYDQFVIKLDDQYKSYVLSKKEDVSLAEINFVVLDAGICVMLNDEKIELFHRKSTSQQVKILSDPIAKEDIKLFTDGSKIIFSKDNELNSMRMKQP